MMIVQGTLMLSVELKRCALRATRSAAVICICLALAACGQSRERAQAPERDVLADYRILIGELRAQGLIDCPDERIDPGWTFESIFFFKAHNLSVNCDRRDEERGFTHLGLDRAEIRLERVRNRVWKISYLGLEENRADMATNRDRALLFLRMLRHYDPEVVARAERAVLARQRIGPFDAESRGEVLRITVGTGRTAAGPGNIWISVQNLTVSPDRSALISDTWIARSLAGLALIGIVIGFPYAAYCRFKIDRGEELTKSQAWRALAAAWAVIGGLLILLFLPWDWL